MGWETVIAAIIGSLVSGLIFGVTLPYLERRIPWLRWFKGFLEGWETDQKGRLLLFYVLKYSFFFAALYILIVRRTVIVRSSSDFLSVVLAFVVVLIVLRILNIYGHPRQVSSPEHTKSPFQNGNFFPNL